VRQVGSDGCVTVDDRSYDVGLNHKGKAVALLVNAPARQFEVWEDRTMLTCLPIKGVQGAPMAVEHFIGWMREPARVEQRRGRPQGRAGSFRQLALWDEPSASSHQEHHDCSRWHDPAGPPGLGVLLLPHAWMMG